MKAVLGGALVTFGLMAGLNERPVMAWVLTLVGCAWCAQQRYEDE